MTKLISKYKNIYIFLITLSIIGLLSGYFYYQIQPSTTKSEIKENLNIKENTNGRINNITKRLKDNTKILIFSILVIPIIINLFNIFYKPFEIGFIFNALSIYNTKFSLIYTISYLTIPFIISLILTRISITIIHNIIKYLLIKDKQSKKIIKSSLKKYILLLIISIIYEIIIIILSPYINTYLMTIFSL